MRLIKDRYYTPYEIHKAQVLRRMTIDGEIVPYAYDTILQMVRKDIKGDNDMNVQKREETYYILGENLMNYIKKNNHKFY
jgi:hypothetical protein